MNKRFIFNLLLLFALSAGAQDEVLSLQQCRELALENNKEMAVAVKKTKSAHFTMKSYRGNFFPNINVNGMGMYSNVDGTLGIPIGDIPLSLPILPGIRLEHTFHLPDLNLDYKAKTFFTAGVSLEQPIYMGGKIMSAFKMSKLGKEMAQLNEHLTASEVILATDNAYALLVKAKEMKKVAESYHAVLQELMRNVESACKHGLKTQNDRLKVQVKLNESELGMRKAENAERLASMNLCHYIGKPLDTPIAVADDLPAISMEMEAQADDISTRPEFGLLSKKVDIAQQQVKLNRSAVLPQIGVRAAYDYANGLEIGNQKLFDNAGFSVMLSVKIPIYHFGERYHKIHAAKTNLELARLEQADLNEKMLLELNQTANNLDEARLEAEISERSLAQAEENMRVSKSQYEAGMESLSEHLEAQALWQQAYATKVDASFQLYLSNIKYLKATGQLK